LGKVFMAGSILARDLCRLLPFLWEAANLNYVIIA